MSVFGYQPTYKPSIQNQTMGGAATPLGQNPLFASKQGSVNYGAPTLPNGQQFMGGAPAPSPSAHPGFAMNWNPEAKNPWTSGYAPDAKAIGFQDPLTGRAMSMPTADNLHAYTPFSPFFDKTPWGGGLGNMSTSSWHTAPQDLYSAISSMSIDQLNRMDWNAVQDQFRRAAQSLSDAYAGNNYHDGGHMNGQQGGQNWLENSYNLLVQRAAKENVF
jgi:hypothetical protein